MIIFLFKKNLPFFSRKSPRFAIEKTGIFTSYFLQIALTFNARVTSDPELTIHNLELSKSISFTRYPLNNISLL